MSINFYKVTDLELTSIADAIRSKANINESLTFPDGFISGIEEAGGYATITIKDYIERTFTNVETGNNKIGVYAFFGCRSLTEASFPNCNEIGLYAFESCSQLSIIFFPKCSFINGRAF